MDGEEGEAYTARIAGELRQELGIPERGKGAIDLAIEASGAPTCVQIGLAVLKPAYVLSKYIPIYHRTDQDIHTTSGTYVQVGMGAKMTVPVPLFHIISKQLHVVGSFRYGSGDYPLAISLVERGLIDLKPLVTQRFKFENAKEAFETTKVGKDKNGKGVIKCIIDGPE